MECAAFMWYMKTSLVRLVLLYTAIVDGDSLTEIYSKVKNVVHEQSGNLIWVPSNETIWMECSYEHSVGGLCTNVGDSSYKLMYML